MPGPATDEQVARYRAKRASGWSQEKAARYVGRSAAWGYKIERKDKETQLRREQTEGGEPLALHELDGGVKDCLNDFNLFAEVFLARRPVPWRLDAANRVVEWLTDKSKDTYAVVNCPPRAGKTTLFTMDIPLWLMAGGGVCDPEIGRAIRILLGHRTEKISKQYVTVLRNTLDLTTPFYCKETKRDAELVLAHAFGRFHPKKSFGEWDLWRDDRFAIAQIGDRRIYQKEPTVQAASREGAFLGTRVDLSVWDDLVVSENCRNITVAETTNNWWENEAEARIEPGGVNMLVGQRLSNLDLFRFQLDKSFTDDAGEAIRLYEHVIYPAHHDPTCTAGTVTEACSQWDGRPDGEGCLLDSYRLNPRHLQQAMTKGAYRTVYQQEDSNPEDALVQEAWIYGGKDADGYEADGCLDNDRSFYEWPDKLGLVDVCCVDPSQSNFWAYEWWAVEPTEPHRAWLIWGQRRKMPAGTDSGFLDWNPRDNRHVGAMEEIQQLSGDLGHPIKIWVVEMNAAHKALGQTHAFRTWRKKWPLTTVIEFSTQGSNKGNNELGLQAIVPYRYKLALDRLPYARGIDVRNYLKTKIDELLKYPNYPTDDTVMANWFLHYNMNQILWKARQLNSPTYNLPSDEEELPAFLEETSYIAS